MQQQHTVSWPVWPLQGGRQHSPVVEVQPASISCMDVTPSASRRSGDHFTERTVHTINNRAHLADPDLQHAAVGGGQQNASEM